MTKSNFLFRAWDKLGICTSTICLIHCLATPILLLIFPVSSFPYLRDHLVHEVLSIVVVISIMIAVYPHCRKHGHKDIIIFALVGTLFILAPLFLTDHADETIHHISTMLGSLFLITAHIKNMKVRHGKCQLETKCSGNHSS